MEAAGRREKLLERLSTASAPVSASQLAAEFSVSRQIIVGDIAILRAAGKKISATPRGYVIPKETGGLVRVITCRHDADAMRDELYAIVDQGCTVVNVIVEHPIYNELTGSLQLSSRYDVDCFINQCRETGAEPLSALTRGVHFHTISCPDEAAYRRVQKVLKEMGILYSAENA